jgi:NACalpha-BTF3-like transcription factor
MKTVTVTLTKAEAEALWTMASMACPEDDLHEVMEQLGMSRAQAKKAVEAREKLARAAFS